MVKYTSNNLVQIAYSSHPLNYLTIDRLSCQTELVEYDKLDLDDLKQLRYKVMTTVIPDAYVFQKQIQDEVVNIIEESIKRKE